MPNKLFVIDAFTKNRYSGNPAAVCLLENKLLSDNEMQQVAKEMNLSETAFVKPLDHSLVNKATLFGLRWFTPTNEVPLCGHATLASSHALFAECGNENSLIVFETMSGKLMAKKDGTSIILDFPLNKPEKIDPSLVKYILEVIPFEVKDVLYSPTTKKLLIRILDSYKRTDLEGMANLNGDKLLQCKSELTVKGVIVTLKGAEDFDFYSRYFAPWVGIPEDPVTGSAHTVLGPYWSEECGKTLLKARQCSPRGGELTVMVRDDGRVDLYGNAATVLRGELEI
ncbi:phenazine biosynthesis-like domain-containing protein [Artemia franciscana]|uniref:Phenazine biosynthesis-like domain-containing protein n=1 Tax=Artemia franciscana TaxID=6661 RepID=A0AA88I9B6_ARTSF|nr:hypothetical protein QYM36_006431 [Artemia franciscana]